MADEIRTTVSLSASKGGASINSGSITDSPDMTGVDMGTATQNVGTANEDLDIHEDIASPVHIVVKNLDEANYVEIFKDSGDAHLLSKLFPGQACLLMNVPVPIYAKANTAPVQVQFWVTEA